MITQKPIGKSIYDHYSMENIHRVEPANSVFNLYLLAVSEIGDIGHW